MKKFDPTLDYYAELELTTGASAQEVNKAYKRLASRYHPDRHQGNELEDLAREKLEKLNAAYDVLRDTQVRSQYDAARRGGNYTATERGTPPPYPQQVPMQAGRFIRTLAVIGGITLLFRFVRSPRIVLSTVAIIAIAWLVPKLFKKLFKKN